MNVKTVSGKISVGLAMALVASIALSVVFAFAIGGDPAAVGASPALAVLAGILSVTFTLSAPLSLLVGLYAMIRLKDRSVIKPLGLAYLLTLALFLLGELSFPH